MIQVTWISLNTRRWGTISLFTQTIAEDEVNASLCYWFRSLIITYAHATTTATTTAATTATSYACFSLITPSELTRKLSILGRSNRRPRIHNSNKSALRMSSLIF